MGWGKSELKAKIDTSIKVSPKKNQVVVVVCLIGFLLFGAIGCLFSWAGKDYIAPLLIGGVFALMSTAAFLLTYKNNDFDVNQPFELSHTEDGINVKMDPALFTRKHEFAKVVSLMAHTRKLPTPSGVIDEFGNIVRDSQVQAQKIANEANNTIESVLSNNLSNITGIESGQNFYKEENTHLSTNGANLKNMVAK